ncbi:MAG: S41 family peptidase [Bacteroidales bacterium]
MNLLKWLKSWRSVTIAVTIGIISTVFIAFDDSDDFELVKYMDIYNSLVRELRLNYVDEVEVSEIFNTSIDKMLETLDPYTVYYPESEIEDYKFLTTGQYGGIGALIRNEKKKIVIEEIYENYPAHKAGLKAGDVIMKIGDKSAEKSNSDDISVLMKGMPNTEVELTIYRPSTSQTITKKLVRERIKVENVPYFGMIDESTGYINLSGFTPNAYGEVRNAFLKLKEQNASRLIIDLRGNPGGLLIEAVNIVSLFVEKGTHIVSMKGKLKESNNRFVTTYDPVDLNIPICVLVNRNSASASEIVSGALQDLDRAVIVGERTYGKGLVQETRDLSYNAKLKVTTAKYYIPSGRCIQALDYSHRNPDGSVGHVPDSLISEFKTKSGRKVYDGGGISPDLKSSDISLSPVSQYLVSNFILFDYASLFESTHDSIVAPVQFKISEKDYESFVNYVKSLKTEYKSETQKAIEQLVEVAKKEQYYDKTAREIEALKSSVKHNITDDMLMFKSEIKQLLEDEIVKRYYYRKGVIKKNLAESESIKNAMELMKNINNYNSLLKPK